MEWKNKSGAQSTMKTMFYLDCYIQILELITPITPLLSSFTAKKPPCIKLSCGIIWFWMIFILIGVRVEGGGTLDEVLI